MQIRSRSHRAVRLSVAALAAGGTLLGLATPAFAASQPFTPGDVVVYRVGDGTTTLGSGAAPVFIDEYSPSGTLVESVPLPTTASGSDDPLVASGTATSEGELTDSADGQYLMVTGYDAAVGASDPSAATSTSVPRVVGRVDANADIDTTTALTDMSSANNIRSATSSDGTHIWVGGAAGGVRYTTLGSTTSTGLSTTFTNGREVTISNGQLFVSSDSTKSTSSGFSISTVGSGEPTTGSQTVTNLSGIPTGSSFEPYQYVFLTLGSATSPNTLYVADNKAGSIDKFTLSGSTWVAEGSTTLAGAVGLTGSVVAGQAVLFATTTNSSGTTGTLTKVVDSAASAATMSGTSTLLATAPANEAFRGVAFAPVSLNTGNGLPESPLTVALPLLAATGLAGYVALRRRQRVA